MLFIWAFEDPYFLEVKIAPTGSKCCETTFLLVVPLMFSVAMDMFAVHPWILHFTTSRKCSNGLTDLKLITDKFTCLWSIWALLHYPAGSNDQETRTIVWTLATMIHRYDVECKQWLSSTKQCCIQVTISQVQVTLESFVFESNKYKSKPSHSVLQAKTNWSLIMIPTQASQYSWPVWCDKVWLDL